MVRRLARVLVSFSALMLVHTAGAAELSAEYLDGLWSLDGKEACGSDSFEYVALRADGVVETGDNGRPDGAGFWELKEDEMIFHLTSSPAFHHDELKGMEGVYDQFRIRVLTYNVEDDQFGTIGILGNQVARAVFVRCP